MPEWLCFARDDSVIVSTFRDIIVRCYWQSPFDIEGVRYSLCQSGSIALLCNLKNIEWCVDIIEQYPLNILWTVLSNIHWILCKQYWAITIEYAVGSIEQYPSNILWTVLRNIYCMLAVLLNTHSPWTVLRYIHCIMCTILRNVHSKHVENENFMSSEAFPLSK
jgi:hypothetical protein